MKNKIITTPKVYLIGQSKMNAEEIRRFADDEGFSKEANDSDTPLGKIVDIAEDVSSSYTHSEIIPEFGGRFCYRSWAKGRPTDEYNENILQDAHGSVLQHSTFNLAITGVSRSLTHELIRHGVGFSTSQESQRYVDASSANFVMPPLMLYFLENDIECGEAQSWLSDNMDALEKYSGWQAWYEGELSDALDDGRIPIDADLRALTVNEITENEAHAKMMTRIRKRANEAARAHLPNAIETKLFWTGNARGFRHVLELRGADAADLEIKRLSVEMAKVLKPEAPSLFSDIEIVPGAFGVDTITTKYHKV